MNFDDLFKPKPDLVAPVATGIPSFTGDGSHERRYSLAALEKEAQIMAATPEGGRNHQLNTSAFNLAQLIPHVSQGEIINALTPAAQQTGLGLREIQTTLASGIASGLKHPRRIPPPQPEGKLTFIPNPAAGSANEIEELGLEGTLFSARPVLEHIQQFALSRMTAPLAVLGGCMLRALAAIPPHVVLPPIIGGVGSLNMLIGIVGPSGAGKGASEMAARDCFTWPQNQATAPLGSGEGITHAFARPPTITEKKNDDPAIENGIVWENRSVIFDSPEIDQMAAIKDRRGSTLMAQIRSAYSGERLGMQYVDTSRRIILPAHSYRFGLSVGIQPGRAEWLLEDAEGGTPQRFLWLPVTNKSITATPPETPTPWTWRAPEAKPAGGLGVVRDLRSGRVILPIPASVAHTIREAHAARARGEGEALDGHALYTRLKAAMALAVLDERLAMSEADWALAGIVMEISDATRNLIMSELIRQREAANAAKAKGDAAREVIREEEYASRTIARVSQVLIPKLKAAGQMSRSKARKVLASRDREWFDDALSALENTGQIHVENTENGSVISWVEK